MGENFMVFKSDELYIAIVEEKISMMCLRSIDQTKTFYCIIWDATLTDFIWYCWHNRKAY